MPSEPPMIQRIFPKRCGSGENGANPKVSDNINAGMRKSVLLFLVVLSITCGFLGSFFEPIQILIEEAIWKMFHVRKA